MTREEKKVTTKYIDSEKLYKQVDELMAHFAELEKETKPDDEDLSIFYQGKVKMCSELLDIINSLQHEQPEVDLEKEQDELTWEDIELIDYAMFTVDCREGYDGTESYHRKVLEEYHKLKQSIEEYADRIIKEQKNK